MLFRSPQYHVIAAGSLLGVAVNRERYSFPVGKVEPLYMYPMQFDEFLSALSQDMLAEEIRNCFLEKRKLSPLLHQQALQLYREYLVIGGMPEAVSIYAGERSLFDAIQSQSAILDTYVADMAKYAQPGDTAKIMACFDSIPAQLAKDNRKFQYKVVAKGGKASLFGASIDWLMASGIITRCERAEHGIHPLEIHRDLSSFKLYLCDPGLLTAKAGIVPHEIIGGYDHIFIGALTENFVANTLEKNGYRLYYWTSGGTAEVDFLIEKQFGEMSRGK